MQRVAAVFFVCSMFVLFAIAGCNDDGGQSVADGDSTGCTKDTDCKGDRVCENGACVSPTDGDLPDGDAVDPDPEDIDSVDGDEADPEPDSIETTEDVEVDGDESDPEPDSIETTEDVETDGDESDPDPENTETTEDVDVEVDGDVEPEQDAEPGDPCDPNPCTTAHKTVCTDNGDGIAVCSCDEGYQDYGDGSCRPADPCATDTTCLGEHRECLNNQGLTQCGDCLAGYHEEHNLCVANVACDENSCNGHGVCNDSTGVPVCTCNQGYAGDACGQCDEANGWHMNGAGDACTTNPCDPNPCDASAHRVCEPGTGACLCDTGYCDIDDACVADGAASPDHDCGICNSVLNKHGWSARPAGHECRAAVDACDAADMCDGINMDCGADAFVSDGQPCGDNDQCVNGQCVDCFDAAGCADMDWGEQNPECAESICSPEHTCTYTLAPQGTVCGSEDQCNDSGVCVDCLDVGSCGDYVEDANPCTSLACENQQCTDVIDDSNSCDLGNPCATNARCENGVCVGDNGSWCFIDGQCVDEGVSIDEDGCAVCDPAQSTTSWTNIDGIACAVSDDNNPCTDEVCRDGLCAFEVDTSNGCNDADTCTYDDTCQPNGQCRGVAYDCGDYGLCQGNGHCSCDTGYAGEVCDECAEGYDAYPNCRTVKSIVAGQYHTCALLYSGSIYCWGLSHFGQLGIGTATSSPTATEVNISDSVYITAGENHTCAVLETGRPFCWGENSSGQIGRETPTEIRVPVSVQYIGIVAAIEAGGGHTCALGENDILYCWGDNSYGQLGDGTTTNSSSPVEITAAGNAAVAMALGYDHSCMLLGNNTVECWGKNNYGQLGNGTTRDSVYPAPVSGLSSAVAIGTGRTHTCAVMDNGTVQCWGYNTSGQLGNASTESQSVPVSVQGISAAIQVTAGSGHTCALLDNGTVKCWGNNYYGQLGDDTTEHRNTPVTVEGLGAVAGIAAGSVHTCALMKDGTVMCWGANSSYQLGNGSTTSSSTPVKVRNLP